VVQGRSPTQGVPPKREYIFHPNVLQLPVGGRRKTPSRKLSGLQTRGGGDAEEEVAEDIQGYNGKGVLFQPYHSRHVLRGGAPSQDTGTGAASDTSGVSDRSCHNGAQGPFGFTLTTCQSVRAPNVNSLHLDEMFKVAMGVI
jgi:hypothetical protein